MSDTALKDGREKQKKETMESAPPRIDEVVDLQTAARALSGKFKLRSSDYRGLLLFLKTGKIRAGFHVAASPTIWIPLAERYWVGLASNRFAAKKNDDTGSRVHRVKLSDFRKEYIDAWLNAREDSNSVSRDQVQTVFQDFSLDERKFFDVVISKASWMGFVQANDIGEPPRGQSSPGSGRHELPSWKTLMPFFAAYLATEARKNPNLGVRSEAKKLTSNIMEYAKRQNPGQAFPSGVDVEVRKFLKLLSDQS